MTQRAQEAQKGLLILKDQQEKAPGAAEGVSLPPWVHLAACSAEGLRIVWVPERAPALLRVLARAVEEQAAE